MKEPTIADKKPIVLEVAAGTYFYCTCGDSTNQPFCDGSHKGTEFRPEKVDVAEDCKIAFCQCKRTGNQPRCDGAHNNL